MWPGSSSRSGQRRHPPFLLAVPALCVCGYAVACGDSCFQFVSNPGAGTVQIAAGGDASCSLAKTFGAAQFRVGTSSTSNEGAVSDTGGGATAVQHIFVT